MIISDFRIAADRDGIDAIRMIRRSQHADIPSLLITGDSSADELDSINEAAWR